MMDVLLYLIAGFLLLMIIQHEFKMLLPKSLKKKILLLFKKKKKNRKNRQTNYDEAYPDIAVQIERSIGGRLVNKRVTDDEPFPADEFYEALSSVMDYMKAEDKEKYDIGVVEQKCKKVLLLRAKGSKELWYATKEVAFEIFDLQHSLERQLWELEKQKKIAQLELKEVASDN